jgi:molecular chaperone DnaJ
MQGKRDYYAVLGVERTADGSEIKRAYRRLAMDHHPDRNPGDHAAEERFKELAEAYQILSDPQRRDLYDRYGHAGPQQAGFQGFSGVEDILSHFADFFGGGFGGFGGGRGPRTEQGSDLQEELTVTFLEAARGCHKALTLQRLIHCSACAGSGAKAGTQPAVCSTCGGRGQVAHNQGIFMIATTCPTCRGRGRVVRDKCAECRGAGVERSTEEITINVPAGIDDGQTLRVPGKGQAVSGGVPGHLYVTFRVEPDPRFERQGDDLFTEVRVSFAKAALGATIKVPTLDGDIDLTVAPGTQPGAVKVLRGRGMPNVQGRGVGDLAVRLSVVVPEHLSDEQQRLIEELAKHDPAQEAPPRAGDGVSDSEDDGAGFFFRRKKKKKR